jgi:hypothetical protein
MRPGERIVKAMQELPRASVTDLQVDADENSRSYGFTSGGGGAASGSGVSSRGASMPGADDRDAKLVGAGADNEGSSGFDTVEKAVTKPEGKQIKFSAPTLNFAIKALGEKVRI